MDGSFKSIEKTGKERLFDLEREGKYLFHGSGFKLDTLEPRQAHNFPTPGEKIPDGELAVFASELSNVAIFMAVISKPNTPRGFRSGFSGKGDSDVEYRVTKETMDQIKNAKGYVHVFDRDNFQRRGKSSEWISTKSVQPIEIIEVSEKDLPDNIEVKDF